MSPLTKLALFTVTAVAEILGCYLVFLWVHGTRSVLLLLGSAAHDALTAGCTSRSRSSGAGSWRSRQSTVGT